MKLIRSEAIPIRHLAPEAPALRERSGARGGLRPHAGPTSTPTGWLTSRVGSMLLSRGPR